MARQATGTTLSAKPSTETWHKIYIGCITSFPLKSVTACRHWIAQRIVASSSIFGNASTCISKFRGTKKKKKSTVTDLPLWRVSTCVPINYYAPCSIWCDACNFSRAGSTSNCITVNGLVNEKEGVCYLETKHLSFFKRLFEAAPLKSRCRPYTLRPPKNPILKGCH